ncbi:DNA polymerase III subunit alpha [Candidatus Magnetomonas plexicatena]|uniref:DNA polymerase III subunit alpha n=1 Tax=Candidatus Magnetomonas plexicatena TaxID=2552947 RepID=UPI001C78FB9B|nr:DNA polymerase III subunit alpha [Nitrospirales bacterium LBB_01]
MHHANYVPLHLHTQYSLLDGAIRIDELVEKAVAYKLAALAITDHGNLFGAMDFYKKVSDAGIKPIIGSEVYISNGSRLEKTKGSYHHLILLAKNMDGYKNLVSLVTKAYTEGFYYKPRIDKDLLAQYSGGLIALTACMKGEVPYLLQQGQTDKAREAALFFKHIFGPDFYIEIQSNGLPEQEALNKQLIELSYDTHIKLVATNDCHYLMRDDAKAHEILLCIQTGKTIYDDDRLKFKTDGLYFKSPQEMAAAFSYIPEAVTNTREVAEKCNLTFKLYDIRLPRYNLKDNQTPEDYLEKLARAGLAVKVSPTPDTQYVDRFETELKVIKKMGFASYFLIVWDFINYARTQGIPVGPGRGSAAGSLVAYCLDITDIDPLKYNLLFERFLNPERISMPDIDVDFCKDRRGEVIAYTAQRYGKDHVAQIITFGTMAAKAAIRDVGRALAMPYAEVDRIAKLIPLTLNITIKEAMQAEPELKNAYEKSEEIKNLIDIAMRLEGLCRHASTHAAGVVISPTPLTDYTPLYKPTNEDNIITQFDMGSIEKMGLLKFDFLGLKTLTVIKQTQEYLKEKGVELDLKGISFDDEQTYRLLGQGTSTGVFQLESAGMKDILIKMAPNRFEDLIALVALYRPGPIGSGMIDDFIKRKKGLIPVQYDLPELKDILDETYGVILYQEQVMRIANKLASFTMGQADILRKAMGKKISYEMDKQKDDFVSGAIKNGIKEAMAVKIFDLMAMFAKYGFNKSHSAAYAYISYLTAYLKAHYSVEFMAANLSTEDSSEKVVKFIKECREMAIEILPPDINVSGRKFKIIGSAISFGLEAVKGVGSAAIESVLEIRENGVFMSLEDFIGRVDSRRVNKKVIESLIKAGAFDSMIKTRKGAVDNLDALLNSSGHSTPSLFGSMPVFTGTGIEVEWDENEKLSNEKQSLGFYITGHPLRNYERELKQLNITKTCLFESFMDKEEVKVAGIVSVLTKKQVKDNKGQMAIVQLEDDEGAVEVVVFPDTFSRSDSFLKKDALVVIRGKLEVSEKGSKIIATEVQRLQSAIDDSYKQMEIRLRQKYCNTATFVKLKETLSEVRGPLPVYLKLYGGETITTIVTAYNVSVESGLINKIEDILERGSVSLN